jgi:hypothetical protein
MSETMAATEATLVQETLENFARCAKLIVDARDEHRIQLTADAVPAALRLMAKRLEQAAGATRERRFEMLRALADGGLQARCLQLIEEATHRTDPVRGHELASWLECEGV